MSVLYFGYPEAHEDDAERAARAGLAVIDAVGRLATPEPLNVRIGIATGLVVVGDLIGEGAAQERGELPVRVRNHRHRLEPDWGEIIATSSASTSTGDAIQMPPDAPLVSRA